MFHLDGGGALHHAVWHSQDSFASLLFEYDVDLLARDRQGRTPLHVACRVGNIRTTTLLLVKLMQTAIRDKTSELKADMDTTHAHLNPVQRDQALVEMASRYEKDVDYRKYLCAQDDMGRNPLHIAAMYGHLVLVEALLELNAPLGNVCKLGRQPVHFAAACGHFEVVQLLVNDHLCDVAREDARGDSLVLVAAKASHTKIAMWLLTLSTEDARRAKLVSDDGTTLLHSASVAGDVRFAQFLISHGMNPNARDQRGVTPLNLARAMGEIEVGALLRASGAFENACFAAATTTTTTATATAAKKMNRLQAMEDASNGSLAAAPVAVPRPPPPAVVDRRQSKLGRRGTSLMNKGLGEGDRFLTTHEDAVRGWFRRLLRWEEEEETRSESPLFFRSGGGRGGGATIGSDGSFSFRKWREAHRVSQVPLLHFAAATGHLQMVQSLVTAGVSVDTIDPWGWTPLCHAAYHGRLAVVQYLCSPEVARISESVAEASSGVALTMEERVCFKTTAPRLTTAAGTRSGFKTTAPRLDSGFKVKWVKMLVGFTPCLLSAHQGHERVAQCLLTFGSPLDDRVGAASSSSSSSSSSSPLALSPLHFAGEDGLTCHGLSLLHVACFRGLEALASYLLRRDIACTVVTLEPPSPLSATAEGGTPSNTHGGTQDRPRRIYSARRQARAVATKGAEEEEGHDCLGPALLLLRFHGLTPLQMAIANGKVAVAHSIKRHAEGLEADAEDHSGIDSSLTSAMLRIPGHPHPFTTSSGGGSGSSRTSSGFPAGSKDCPVFLPSEKVLHLSQHFPAPPLPVYFGDSTEARPPHSVSSSSSPPPPGKMARPPREERVASPRSRRATKISTANTKRGSTTTTTTPSAVHAALSSSSGNVELAPQAPHGRSLLFQDTRTPRHHASPLTPRPLTPHASPLTLTPHPHPYSAASRIEDCCCACGGQQRRAHFGWCLLFWNGPIV